MDRLEQQQHDLADFTKDAVALLKTQESPTRKKRLISPTSTNENEDQQTDTKPTAPNAFDILRTAGKRQQQLYNVDSIAKLTLEQVIKDYFNFNLSRTDNFAKTGKDVDKNISMIRTVVKFSLHVAQLSLKDADITVQQVQQPMPAPDSPDFIQWNQDRNQAAMKIRAHAMKAMQEIEEQLQQLAPEPKKESKPSHPNKTKKRKAAPKPQPKPLVSALYHRIEAAVKTGLFSKTTFTIILPN